MYDQPLKPDKEMTTSSRGNRRRKILLISCLGVLGVLGGLVFVALCVFVLYPSNRALVRSAWGNTEQPFLVQIQVWDRRPHLLNKYEFRDPATIAVLESMFVEELKRVAGLSRPAHVAYTIELMYPRFKSGYPPRIDVWHHQGEQLWSMGKGVYRVYGDFDLFLKSIPGRRAVQLLNSQSASDRDSGRKIQQASGDEMVDVLLELARSENPYVQSDAIRNLTSLMGEKLPSPSYQNWTIDRTPLLAASASRTDDICQAAIKILRSELPEIGRDASSGNLGVIRDLCRCLAQTGHQTTADQLATLLTAQREPFVIDKMMTCLESIYGLPPTYDQHGICGNSSAAEIAQFAAAEQKRRLAARDKLLKWHRQHADDDRSTQLTAALDEWHDRLLTLGSNGSGYRTHPHEEVWGLLRLGPDLVPVLEAKQKATGDLSEKGSLEFVKAYLTAACDRDLVNQLLGGDIRQQILACYIVAASGHSDWKKELTQFLYTPLPPASSALKVQDVVALRSAAAAALLFCDGPASLPLIEKAHTSGFENEQAIAALQFFAMPAGQ